MRYEAVLRGSSFNVLSVILEMFYVRVYMN